MAISSPIPFKSFLAIASFILLSSFSIALNDAPVLGYSMKERVALNSLKANLDNPFLNKVWNGAHCYTNASLWFGVRCNSNGLVIEIALENMGLKGDLRSNAFISFTELSVLSIKNNSLSGNLVIDFSFNRKLTRVDLSGNLFSGQVPISLAGIPVLKALFLQGNSLTGSIPAFNQPSLEDFNVSDNNLGGPIPKTRALQSFGHDSYDGNPGLCGPPTSMACNSNGNDTAEHGDETDHKSFLGSLKHIVKGYLFVIEFVFLIVIILLFVLYYKKSRKLKKMMNEYKERGEIKHEKSEDDRLVIAEVEGDQRSRPIGNNNLNTRPIGNNNYLNTSGQERRKLVFVADNYGQGSNSTFEMSDLLKASAEELGQGTFGNCYKAMMEGKPPVVVKRLRNLKPMTDEEFTKRLLQIANQKHPNLLPILAYHNNKQNERLLLYKYVEKGNLFDRLHGEFLVFYLAASLDFFRTCFMSV